MKQLPINLDIRGRKVIIDGGESIAARRAERALNAGGEVHIYSEVLSDEFLPYLDHPSLHVHKRPPAERDFVSAILAYGTTEDPDRDAALYAMANDMRVLTNVADNLQYCDFITPSIIDRSPLVISISSGGAAPIISRILRARIEAIIPAAFGGFAEWAGNLRDKVMEKISDPAKRRQFWERTIDGSVSDLYLTGNIAGAEKRFNETLDSADDADSFSKLGEVYLVGAGPGDPDLLTFRALYLMQRADVVLYDRLLGDGIMDLVRRDAERIYVGKKAKNHTMEQEDISLLMVRLANEGKKVLRLKGGDPFIFGRGGEELETLAEAGIPFQIVPGITAASGCASYAGIPLTHRDHAQSCVFTTAHGKDGVLALDWELLAKPNQTVAVYMGLGSLDILTKEFIAHGVSSEMPVAVIDKGTRQDQQVIVGTLGDIYEKVSNVGLTGPSLSVIGTVVGLSETLGWFNIDSVEKHRLSIQAKSDL